MRSFYLKFTYESSYFSTFEKPCPKFQSEMQKKLQKSAPVYFESASL